MSHEVIFEDDSAIDDRNMVGHLAIVPGAPTGMLAWLIKSKIAKDGKQAEQILLYAAIGAVVLGLGFYFIGGVQHTRTATPAEEQIINEMKAEAQMRLGV